MKEHNTFPNQPYTVTPWRRQVSLPVLVGLSEIARITGASSPAVVANWRARSSDFPPERVSGTQPRFSLTEVYDWLLHSGPRGREVKPLEPGTWYRQVLRSFHTTAALPSTRGAAVALVLLQHLLLTGSIGGGEARWRGLVEAALQPTAEFDESGFASLVSDTAGFVEQARPDLIDVLVEPLTVDSANAGYLADLVDALDQVTDRSARRRLNAVFDEEREARGRPPKSTVRHVATLLAALARVGTAGAVLDPAAGEASVLVACARRSSGVRLLGQEIDPVTWRIGRAVLEVRGMKADLGRPGLDSLRDDQHAQERVDAVVVDPPLGADAPPLERWVEFGLRHVTPGGRVVVVLPAHEVVQVAAARRKPSSAVGRLVERLASDGLVEAMVVLPRNLRPDIVGPMLLLCIDTGGRHATIPVFVATVEGDSLGDAIEPLADRISRGRLNDAARRGSAGFDVHRASADELRPVLDNAVRNLESETRAMPVQRRVPAVADVRDQGQGAWLEERIQRVEAELDAFTSRHAALTRSVRDLLAELDRLKGEMGPEIADRLSYDIMRVRRDLG